MSELRTNYCKFIRRVKIANVVDKTRLPFEEYVYWHALISPNWVLVALSIGLAVPRNL